MPQFLEMGLTAVAVVGAVAAHLHGDVLFGIVLGAGRGIWRIDSPRVPNQQRLSGIPSQPLITPSYLGVPLANSCRPQAGNSAMPNNDEDERPASGGSNSRSSRRAP